MPATSRHMAKPGDTDSKNCKVRVTMFLDLDVLEFFKKRAERPGTPAYQTQINLELRRVMESFGSNGADPVSALKQATQLIDVVREQIENRKRA